MAQENRDFVCVPVPTPVLATVADFLRSAQSDTSISEFVCMAVEYLQQNIEDKPEDLGRLIRRSPTGYIWKELTLPAGTQARMKYKGRWHCASVEGHDFVFEGQSLSPSQFANMVTQSSRNAWRDVYLKRPGDSGWTLADTLRCNVRQRRPKK